MKKSTLVAAMMLMLAISACKKTDSGVPDTNPVNSPIAPDGFNFSTTKDVSLQVKLLTNNDQPLQGVMVNVYSPDNVAEGGAVYTGVSDANGNISAILTIPAYLDTLVIDPAYVGLMRNAKVLINGNASNCTFGGSDVYKGDIIPNTDFAPQINRKVQSGTSLLGYTPAISYLGTYDYEGRPRYLVSTDVISSTLLSFINTSLPESKPVPTYHPDYMNSTAETNLNIEKKADVWVTFVSEGAGFLNSLGFYTYSTSNPPKTINDISKITIVIPNASLYGSAGNMRSGDKIHLGQFEAGTSIGFVLLQNAWSRDQQKVISTATMFFADDNLNTATETASYLRHTVLLYDNTNKLFVQGFEDQTRSTNSSDNDFNDLVFYATSNPVEAISNYNINPIDQPLDSDKDGVNNTYDKFPNDATRAYIQYSPAKDTWGTLAFEDLWPTTGDYDLNDLVVGYQYTYIKNAYNQTIEMNADYMIRAIGASFINGFGVQLPFAYSKISTVTGQKQIANYITKNSNGTEAGQTKAVIIPFDDTRALFASGGFTNVYNNTASQISDTAHLYIKFAGAMSDAEMGAAPYNPFLISNQRRGYEIHLPGNVPTDKADTKLFGTSDDNSKPASSRYYLNTENWPWAMSFTEDFEYPSEASNISKAYSYFLTWAKSGGVSNTDWYTNTSGNKNRQYIYKK